MRKDQEVENLFQAVQNTIEAKDTSVEKCKVLNETNLPLLKIKLDETLTLCERVLNRDRNNIEAVSVTPFFFYFFLHKFLISICFPGKKIRRKSFES